MKHLAQQPISLWRSVKGTRLKDFCHNNTTKKQVSISPMKSKANTWLVKHPEFLGN